MEATQSQSHDIELGFKSLTLYCPNTDQKMQQSSCNGDYIGMESCLDMKSCEDDVNVTKTTSYHDHVRRKRESSRNNKTREFPPPISLLARTENLSSHMPFVLKRYYTNDGRLILREEPVRYHEYFRAHRSNGHLTLQLVPLDDAYDSENEPNVEDDDEEEEEEIEEFVDIGGSGCGGGGNGNGGGEMCLKYNNVIMSSSCYLGVPPLPAIKPVHT